MTCRPNTFSVSPVLHAVAACPVEQKNLLCIVLEVGQRTKAQCVEVGRASDMLPDDLRNFLQRWVILRCANPMRTIMCAA